MNSVLLTGAAGTIGSRVLTGVAAHLQVGRIWLLSDESAERSTSILPETEPRPEGHELVIDRVSGELGKPRFGLSEAEFSELASSIDVVVHCAERVTLDDDLQAARTHNVQPVATLIEFLQANPVCRLIHLSSTLIAGSKRGLFTEFDLSCGQEFYNAYDQSKFEAESLVRESDVSSRVTVLRRSFTLDEPYATEQCSQSPLGLLLDRLRRDKRVLFAGDPRMRIDVVPPSYVADTAVALAVHPQMDGQTLHCVAGWHDSWILADFMSAVRKHYKHSKVRFLPPVFGFLGWLARVISLGMWSAFPKRRWGLKPYVRQRTCFDDFLANTQRDSLSISRPTREAGLTELLGTGREDS